jgi:hypothetical protein
MVLIYEVRRWNGFRWYYIYIYTELHEDLFGHSINIKVITATFERLQYCHYRWDGLMKYAVQMASGCMIYVPRFKAVKKH